MTSVPWLDAGQFGRNAGHLQGLTVKAELTDSAHFSGAGIRKEFCRTHWPPRPDDEYLNHNME